MNTPLGFAVTEKPRRTHRAIALLRGARRLAAALVAALVLLALFVAWQSGWRSHAMTTPSMGVAAPVGSLIVSEPVKTSQIHLGQIIVFHPPGEPSVTYAHRVYAVVREGSVELLRTKGDINATPDGWILGQRDLVGRVAIAIPDAGFLVEMLPLGLVGLFVMLLVTSGLSPHTRGPARNAGAALVVCALLLHFHPLERVVLLQARATHGQAVATIVPTGVLPLRVSINGGSHADVVAGQVATLHLAAARKRGAFSIATSVHLHGGWWLLIVAWLSPILAALRQRPRPSRQAWPAAPLSGA
jgi:signal peptidase I